MRFNEIKNDGQLWSFMTSPSSSLVRDLKKIEGDILVLGGSGKMGKELAGLIRNGDSQSGKKRRIMVASSFSNQEDLEIFRRMEVECFRGDLSNENFLESLPDSPHVFYMLGFKFGSRDDWRKTFHLNSIVPYLTGRKYSHSSIVVFSSGNPYPHTDPAGTGCRESDPLEPAGIYGWSIVARESAFSTTALQHPGQNVCYYRLMYAQHLNYGVLIDLAKLIWNGEPVSLKMPAVNLISQRDANEVAIRCLIHCGNPATVLNVAGPVVKVRDIVTRMAGIMGKKHRLEDEGDQMALIANDKNCLDTFGPYRDHVDEMILASAQWIMNGGNTWDKPTYFGRADHKY